MTSPTRPVTRMTANIVGISPQPRLEPTHHAVIMPTATRDPWAKLATLVTPKTSDMPTATKA